MPIARLEKRDLPQIIENIESQGGDASKLRAILDNGQQKHRPGEKVSEISDDELVAELQRQSSVEEGEGLECLICHQGSSRLTNGACDACFQTWAVSCKKSYLATRRQHGDSSSG